MSSECIIAVPALVLSRLYTPDLKKVFKILNDKFGATDIRHVTSRYTGIWAKAQTSIEITFPDNDHLTFFVLSTSIPYVVVNT